jgi:hypothetical protein
MPAALIQLVAPRAVHACALETVAVDGSENTAPVFRESAGSSFSELGTALAGRSIVSSLVPVCSPALGSVWAAPFAAVLVAAGAPAVVEAVEEQAASPTTAVAQRAPRTT